MRYLLTQSLLSSWQYGLDIGDLGEFGQALRRIPKEPNEAMRKGVEWESLVVYAMDHDDNPGVPKAWWECARYVAEETAGAALQVGLYEQVEVDGMTFLLHGKLDALLAGEIIDYKYKEGYAKYPYRVSQYNGLPQAPMYFALCPEATRFKFRIFDGHDLYLEEYSRDDVPTIEIIIRDFVRWLDAAGLMNEYEAYWRAD